MNTLAKACNLHLILHKVRGEPAFDVAEPVASHDGTWWLVPTSGHRAYPYWTVPLLRLLTGGEQYELPQMPEDHPDHYPPPGPRPPRKTPRGDDIDFVLDWIAATEAAKETEPTPTTGS